MNFNYFTVFHNFGFNCLGMMRCTLPSIKRMELCPLRCKVKEINIIICKCSEIVRFKRSFKKFLFINNIAYNLTVVNNHFQIFTVNGNFLSVNIKIKLFITFNFFRLRHFIKNKLLKSNLIVSIKP